jgi:ribokinase
VTRPILVVGSVNLDVVCAVDHLPAAGQTVTGDDVRLFNGGKGANQAVGVARLGYPVSVLGCVGDDAAGVRLRHGLRAAGVRVRSLITVSRTPSGTALICTDRHGENTIVVSPGANSRLRPRDVERHRAALRAAGMLLLQLEVPLDTVECAAALAHRDGIPVMLDPAPACALPARLLRHITWLTPNETETRTLIGAGTGTLTRAAAHEAARTLRQRGPRAVIIKMGRRGAYLTDGDTARDVPAFRIRAVDSTAAGDAFNAGLAVALMQGQPLPDAARYASAVAAISVTRPGAQPSMPTSRDVRRFLNR